MNVKAKGSKETEVLGVMQKIIPVAITGSKKEVTPLPLLKSKAVNGGLRKPPIIPLAGSTAARLKNRTVLPGPA